MYFWRIKKLKEDLVERTLSESETFQYVIALTVLYGLAEVTLVTPLVAYNVWDVVSAVTVAVITILGTVYVYRCNLGKNGHNFLQKYISLGWVVGVRWFVLVALPATGAYIVFIAVTTALYTDLPEGTTLPDALFFSAVYIPYFWLLGKHMKDTVLA